jgi:hypothetical protein
LATVAGSFSATRSAAFTLPIASDGVPFGA